jgi:NADPH:quinone reductase-like Zn-dependent oxidoreductase
LGLPSTQPVDLVNAIDRLSIRLKAIQIHSSGGVDKLCFEETGDPALESPNDVIVKLRAAAVNRVDIAIRSGQNGAPLSFPHIIGSDGAGTIVAVGRAVTHVNLGDSVCLYPVFGCGRCDFCASERDHMCATRSVLGERRHGTYAEYVSVPGKNCFAIPAGLSFEEAAAFPLVYVTLWRLLITQAELRSGESLLIVGGGGIATAALLVAASLATPIIIASGNAEKLAKAKMLGAEHGINYRHTDFAKEVRSLTGKRGVDVVVDCVGGESWSKSLASLARGGRLVTCGAVAGAAAATDLRRIFWNHLKVFGAAAGTREEFRQLLNFFAVSGAKPIIDRIYPLHDAAKAHQRMEKGESFGKIVLRMDE